MARGHGHGHAASLWLLPVEGWEACATRWGSSVCDQALPCSGVQAVALSPLSTASPSLVTPGLFSPLVCVSGPLLGQAPTHPCLPSHCQNTFSWSGEPGARAACLCFFPLLGRITYYVKYV